jgi:hypothetical protein
MLNRDVFGGTDRRSATDDLAMLVLQYGVAIVALLAALALALNR